MLKSLQKQINETSKSLQKSVQKNFFFAEAPNGEQAPPSEDRHAGERVQRAGRQAHTGRCEIQSWALPVFFGVFNNKK